MIMCTTKGTMKVRNLLATWIFILYIPLSDAQSGSGSGMDPDSEGGVLSSTPSTLVVSPRQPQKEKEVSFTCDHDLLHTPFLVSWYKDLQRLNNWPGHTQTHTMSVTLADTGIYSCRISTEEQHFKMSSPVLVIVRKTPSTPPPHLSPSPGGEDKNYVTHFPAPQSRAYLVINPQRPQYKDEVTFACGHEAVNFDAQEDFSVLWYKDYQLLRSWPDNTPMHRIAAKPTDTGMYWCGINSEKETLRNSSKRHVIVQNAPSIPYPSQVYSVPEQLKYFFQTTGGMIVIVVLTIIGTVVTILVISCVTFKLKKRSPRQGPAMRGKGTRGPLPDVPPQIELDTFEDYVYAEIPYRVPKNIMNLYGDPHIEGGSTSNMHDPHIEAEYVNAFTSWLEETKLSMKTANQFKQHGVSTVHEVSKLSREQMQKIGVSIGDQIRINTALKK